jgi:hypothetical protein
MFLERIYRRKREKGFVYWLFCVKPILTLVHPSTIKVVMKSLAPKPKKGAGVSFEIYY